MIERTRRLANELASELEAVLADVQRSGAEELEITVDEFKKRCEGKE